MNQVQSGLFPLFKCQGKYMFYCKIALKNKPDHQIPAIIKQTATDGRSGKGLAKTQHLVVSMSSSSSYSI